jgi:hypothetical protein
MNPTTIRSQPRWPHNLRMHWYLKSIILWECLNTSTQNIYTPAPRRGRGVYCFTSVRLSHFCCLEKWAYMFNVYKNQQSRQTGSRNLMGRKTLPTIWGYIWSLWPNIRSLQSIVAEKNVTKNVHILSWETFLDPSDFYFLFADLVDFYTHWTYMHIFRHIFLSNYWLQRSDIWSQASYITPYRGKRFSTHQIQKTLSTIWGTYMKLVIKYQIPAINSYWEKCDEKQVRLCVDFRVLGSTDHFHHMIKSATDNSHLIDTFCWQPYLFYGVNCRRNELLGYVSLK